jgi:hypothetical protein
MVMETHVKRKTTWRMHFQVALLFSGPDGI